MTPAPSERDRLLPGQNGHKSAPSESDRSPHNGHKVPGNGSDSEQQKKDLQEAGSLFFKTTAIGALWIGSLLFAIDGSLVTTLATSIGSSFGKANLGPSLGAVYLGGSCAFTPLYGRTSDIYGRKALLLIAGTTFTVATLGCGVAQSMGELLFWRTIAGIGGGGLMSMASVVMSDLVSQRRRGLLQGAGNVVFAAGSALGGPIGGLLNDSVGWRSAFLYQLPLCGLMLIVIAWRISIPLPHYDGSLTRRQRLAQVDWLGSGFVVVSVGCIAGALQLGGNLLDWSSPIVIVLLVVGVLGLAGFLYVEGRVAKSPIIALDVLFTRTVLAAFVANISGAIVVFSTIFQLPNYFLIVKGLSATQAGIHYWPMSAALAVGSLSAGAVINQTGRYRIPLLLSAALTCVTPVLLAATWDDDWPSSYYRYFLDLVWLGLGNGGSISILLVASISSVAHSRMATVTSIFSFSRVFGQTLGVSLSGAIVQARVKTALESALAGRPDAGDLVERIRTDITTIADLPSDVREIATTAYSGALRLLWWFVLGAAVVSTLACVVIPQHELSTRGPLEQEEEEE